MTCLAKQTLVKCSGYIPRKTLQPARPRPYNKLNYGCAFTKYRIHNITLKNNKH